MPRCYLAQIVWGDLKGQIAVRSFGDSKQFHSSLFGSSSGFVTITMPTSGDNIFPAMLAFLITWHHVVQGKLMACLTAILASIVVALKNTEASKFPLITLAFDHIDKLYYGRYRERITGGMHETEPVFKHIGFTTQQQHNRPPYMADVNCLEALA